MTTLDELFSALTLEERGDFFARHGIKPHGHLYAYVIPLWNVSVTITHGRTPKEEVIYTSQRGEWSLVNMGMTSKAPSKRLNYFSKFKEAIKPIKERDMIYCIEADTSWEDPCRRACFLGSWDVGGKTSKASGYFESAEEWATFLGPSKNSGFTECVVIPSLAIEKIRKQSRELLYPATAGFCELLGKIVLEETSRLIKLPARDNYVKLELWIDEINHGPRVTAPL